VLLPLLAEFKRRRVFRALIAYGIAAFAVLQISEPVLHALHLPEWTLTFMVVALGAGFPIVILLAWAFDVSPGGIERAPVRPDRKPGLEGVRLTLILVGIGLLAAAPGVTWHFLVRGGAQRLPERASASRTASLAVLPFVNMSREKDDEYFSDGITEEVINALANVEGLHVVSRTSAFAFKGKNVSVRTIGEELGVGSVLEGSVRRDGSAVRITAQLVNAADGYHLWSQTYDRELRNVFMVEDELARSIVRALRPKLVKASSPLVRQPTASIEAHDLYLRGRHLWNKRTEHGLMKAVEAFQQALDLDPSYALAHVGLADSKSILIEYGTARPAEVLPEAKEHAQKALELDRELGEAHASLGLISTYEFDWKRAELEYRRAIELRPAYASAHQWYALVLINLGRFADARAEAERARQLDPVSLIVNNMVGLVSLENREYSRAIDEFTRTLELDPAFPPTLRALRAAYFYSGRYADALTQLEKLNEKGPEQIATRARILLASGDRAAAVELLRHLEDRSTTKSISPTALAGIYVSLGDKEQGLALLERAYAERDFRLRYLKTDPDWDPLRSDPRFQRLLRQVNLE
jgi:TolB-like protein/Tfp pilus assembly protein PilF